MRKWESSTAYEVTRTMPAPTDHRDFLAFQTRTPEGQPLSGTLHVADPQQARRWLDYLKAQPVSFHSSVAERRALLSVNPCQADALDTLSAAGWSMSARLRLTAESVSGNRWADLIREMADDLDRGRSVDEVVKTHRDQFPSLLRRLLDAGVSLDRLPSVLRNVAGYDRRVERLRAQMRMLWVYLLIPWVIVAGYALLMARTVVPPFQRIFEDMDTTLPTITESTLMVAPWVPSVVVTCTAFLGVVFLAGWALRANSWSFRVMDFLMRVVPMVGRPVWWSLQTRWCDVTRIAVAAGLEFPMALRIAAAEIPWPSVQRWSRIMIVQASESLPDASHTRSTTALPTALTLSARAIAVGDTPSVFGSQREPLEEQLRIRLAKVHSVMIGATIAMVGSLTLYIVLALFLPCLKIHMCVM